MLGEFGVWPEAFGQSKMITSFFRLLPPQVAHRYCFCSLETGIKKALPRKIPFKFRAGS